MSNLVICAKIKNSGKTATNSYGAYDFQQRKFFLF
jgi:hypothetical protein